MGRRTWKGRGKGRREEAKKIEEEMGTKLLGIRKGRGLGKRSGMDLVQAPIPYDACHHDAYLKCTSTLNF